MRWIMYMDKNYTPFEARVAERKTRWSRLTSDA